MLPSLHHGAAVTMSSADLCDLVNRARFEFGENEVRRNDFTSRCKDELDGEHYESFVVTNPNGTTSEVLRLTQDQCLLVAMRESKAVRRRVVEQLNQIAPKFNPASLTRLDILQLAMESEQGRIKAEAERDHAIATKAQIGSRREATAMASAATAKREAARLRDQLGFSTRHATVKAVEGATSRRFDWLPLRKWCVAHGAFPASVADPLYGTVKAWPSDAWGEVYGIDLSELFPSEATQKAAA